MKNFWNNFRGFVKKHKKLTIFLIIVLVIVLLVLYVRSKLKEAEALLNDMMSSQSASVELKSLKQTISATGTIVSVENNNLEAAVNGVDVLTVEVSVGDYVNEGDVICTLDSSSIQTSLDNAKLSLEAAQKNSNSDVAVANRLLNEAQVSRNTKVERDYEDAAKAYDDFLDAKEDLDEAAMELSLANEEYAYRSTNLQNYIDEHGLQDEYALSMDPEGSFYKGKADAAKNDLEAKQNAYDNMEKAFENSITAYNNVVRGYEDSLLNNDSQIMSRNDSLNTSKTNSTVTGLNESKQIEDFEKQIEECTVKAPYSGVITSLSVKEGDRYAGGTLGKIEDVSEFLISAEIDEYDISKLAVGQKVIFKTNGTGDEEFTGTVKEIAPRATLDAKTGTVGANVTYNVKVAIDSDISRFKLDMTAKMAIILSEKENVLAVPYAAVQVDENGEFFIETPDGRIMVEKGIESDYYIEVSGDGIKEGLQVVVPAQNSVNDFIQMIAEEGAMGGF